MTGSSALRLLFAAALCLSQTGANTGIQDSNSSVTLPNWKHNAEYITKCDFNNGQSPFCGWTHLGWTAVPQGAVGSYLLLENSLLYPFGLSRLESEILNLSGVGCLEFWYRASGPNGTGLRVLIKTDVAETEIWTSQATADRSWQQVFIPLSDINGMQVVFEADVGLPEDGEVTIDNVGVRKGPCGEQCAQGDFWADDACTSQCACSTPGGALTCSPASCPENHTCMSSSGAPACLHSAAGTCSLHGDPHITTFDGASHPFVGTCNYVLAQVCTEPAVVPFFRVEVRNEQRGDSSPSIQQVTVDLQGFTVALLKTETSKVLINGRWRSLPLSLNDGAVSISSAGVTVILETDFQLMVLYDAVSGVQVKVPDFYADQVCGLCGNFNLLSDDDYAKPDGSNAADAADLAHSWQSGSEACEAVVHPHRCPPAEEAEYRGESNCGVILSKTSPFAGCSSIIAAEAFFRSCVSEMCSAGGDPQALCEVLQTFAETCQAAGIPLPPWRNSTVCPLECQANSHYNECASGCPATCSDEDAAVSCGVCEERCDCDPGFLLSGGRCVPAEDCGCWVNGQHLEKGESVMQGDCEVQCQCVGQGGVQCSPVSCGQDEVCRVKDGLVGCHTTRVATCHVFGDPHYLTFDGKLYHFQKACNYTLAKTSSRSSVQFTVTSRNENRGNVMWSALNSIALEVQGLHLALRKDKEAYVNGVLTPLPAEPMRGVKVFLVGSYIQVDTDFGLQLLFDGDQRLFVRIEERYFGLMSGLCGTYSDNQYDDFVTPVDVTVSTADEFGNSWKVKDEEWKCSDTIPAPAPCDSKLAKEECSVLNGDAFKACHLKVSVQPYIDSCVYDHCATQANTRQFCTSLESFAAACELAGVDLGDWRRSTVCGAVCPMDCDFDSSECGWTQTMTDSFDWLRRQGPTPTELTGPSHDHTTGSGSYMYIEGDGVYHGDSARMLSPPCQRSGPHCLQFWYHMQGSASAMALNMYLLEGRHATKIWSRSNNQGSTWNRAQVDITVSGAFQIIAEGIRGSSPQSDVAFDDLSIRSGKCSDLTLGPINKVPSTTASSIEIVGAGKTHPVCRLDCNFDSDLCAWNQLLTDSFDWTWQSGPTPTSMTGPTFDHTTGAGHYLYIEGDGVYNGDTARLLSPQCSDSGPQCLQFWYHMHGTADTMGLTAYLLRGGVTQRLWTRRNDRGDAWLLAQVDINASGAFQILFEGRRGTTTLSDVALDDVTLHRGTCADLITASTPQPPIQTTTTQAPVQTTTTQAPVQTTTTQAPVQTTTTQAPVQAPTTQAPIQTTTTQAPVQTTTTQAPVQTTTTQAPVQTTTTQAPVQTTTTQAPVQAPTTQAPIQTTTTQAPVQTTTTQAPVQTTTTQAPVQTTTTQAPVQTTTTQAPVQAPTTQPPAQTTSTQAPVQTPTTQPPVQAPTTQPPVQTPTTQPPIEAPTTQAPVQITTTQAPVQTPTTQPPVQAPTTQPPVQTPTTQPPIEAPTTQAPVQITATQAPVQTTTTQAPVQTTTTQAPIQTTTTQAPVQTTTTQAPVQTTTTQAPVQTTTTQAPVQTTTTQAPVQTTTTQAPIQTTTTQAPVQTTSTQAPVQTTTTQAPAETTSPVPSCPANSHHTDCKPKCEPSCNDLHASRCVIDRPCQPGCVCDDGFVPKWGKCVPVETCGCRDDDGLLHNFAESWTSSYCTKRCTCKREHGTGEIECKDYECSAHEVCHHGDEGDFKCKASVFSECTIDDDPEYHTFDNMKHTFEGKSSYILVRTTNMPQGLPEVYVEGNNKKVDDDDDDDDSENDSRMARDDSDEDSDEDDYTGRLRRLKVKVYNHTVEFKEDRVVVVDGERVRVPFSPFVGLMIMERSSRIYLKTDFGLSVEFDGDKKAEIILPSTYKKKVGGLCGNFDGRKRNDLMKSDGSQAKNVQDFGDSWRVTTDTRTTR